MSGKEITLESPDGKGIVGVLTKAGGICEIKCHYSFSHGEHTFIYIVPEGMMPTLEKAGGSLIFVDSAGQRWSGSDVEYASARGKNA